MGTPIQDRHAQLLAGILDLGQPVGQEETLYDGGAMQVYDFGRIYHHPRLVMPFEIHGALLAAYLDLGAETSQLGYPTSDEMDDPGLFGGKMNTFEHGALRWNAVDGVTPELSFTEPDWVTRVVVKVFDFIAIPIPVGVEIGFSQLAVLLGPLPVVGQLALLLGDATVRRSFHSFSAADLFSLTAQAQQVTPGYVPPDFNTYVEIDIPDGVDAQTVVSLIAQVIEIVEFAYVAGTPSLPNVVGTTNPLFGGQQYLAAAPTGIGVAAAWAKGADGAGINLIDIEQGWFVGHEDLPLLIRLIDGLNEPASHFHGTAVLGILIGKDDTTGIAGLAPECFIELLSHSQPKNQERRERLAEVIAIAASRLSGGDVLLLEVEHVHHLPGGDRILPIEAEQLESDAIKLAVSLGIVVVEAAGNGSFDLDQFVDAAGNHTLNRGLPGEFKDSGAIMVGACRSAVPHEKLNRSNNGTRIDCHAWGERIATTGDPDHQNVRNIYWDPNREYRPGRFGFGGTSGASAIIAGACVLIQQLRTLLTPVVGTGRLGPAAMQALVQDPANGTDSFLIGDKIGSMPDFAKILVNEFQS